VCDTIIEDSLQTASSEALGLVLYVIPFTELHRDERVKSKDRAWSATRDPETINQSSSLSFDESFSHSNSHSDFVLVVNEERHSVEITTIRIIYDTLRHDALSK